MTKKDDSLTDCLNKNAKITILSILYNVQKELENIPYGISVSNYDFECYLQELRTYVEF